MSKKGDVEVVRLKPYQYIHVHDNNTNVTQVVIGPATFTKQDHEQIVGPPQQCIVVPPRHYCVIENPVLRDERTGEILKDKHGQPRVRLGDKEIRFAQQPFALFPQEKLENDTIHQLKVLPVGKALRLRAIRNVDDRQAGDEWLFEGPGTYIPRVEVEEVATVQSRIVKPNTGLLLRARNATTDRTGTARKAGEEYLYLQPGAYLPGVDEEVVSVVEATVLTEQKALHIECLRNFRDIFGKERKAGELWLVDSSLTEAYIAGPCERIVNHVSLTTLNDRQFCVVVDPWRRDETTGEWKQNLGQKEVRPGRTVFFLRPGESLENGIQDVFVLGEEEALLLTAVEAHRDEGGNEHKPGDRWMIYGPRDYIPTNSVRVLERRQNLPLGENEGVYVRDTKTGQVRAVIGKTYMLAPDEELWEKDIPQAVRELLERQTGDFHTFKDSGRSASRRRDATRVVTYSVPHNSVVQVYDFKTKRSRLVFGPDMVMLSPDEQFTVMTLSGDKPKRAGVISTLSLFLGPDFMTDVIVVETSDHARLSLQLAYNWTFDVKIGDEAAGAKVFNVPDFVGDACNAIASRIRGAVAGEAFDTFHKNATNIIRAAVFGYDKQTKEIREKLEFPNNLLIITSVDIQSVEPVDTKTREALMKSVQLAIEITTKSQEATARHEAERREQEAKGRLERQILEDKAEAEKSRMSLLQLQGESAAIESTGASKAEAKAHAAAAFIEGDAQVKQAQLKANAQRIAVEAELHAQQKKNDAEIEFKESLNKIEVERSRELASIEVQKFKSSVGAIGRQTIAAMARAGPEMQVRLLKGLGLQGYFLTDGHSPINLMNAAQSLTGFGSQ